MTVECGICGSDFANSKGLSKHQTEGHRTFMFRRPLEHLYVDGERSMREVADILNTDSGTISRWLERKNVTTRDKSEAKGGPSLSADELRELYWEQEMTTREIADEYGVDNSNVSRKMAREGIDRRPSNHPIYKNQLTKPTLGYGPNWEQKRSERLEFDSWECVVCGIKDHEHKAEYGCSLHVHHITPRREFKDSDGEVNWSSANRMENLMSLCVSCHRRWEELPIQPQVDSPDE